MDDFFKTLPVNADAYSGNTEKYLERLEEPENCDDQRITRKYLGESHKKYSEACQKAVERMSEHPYSHEQCLEQVERLRKASELGDAGDVPTVSEKDLSSLGVRIENREHRLKEDKRFTNLAKE